MGPEFWTLDKPTKLKKCSEFKTPPCDPAPTDGCCAVIPCSYCLTWTPANKPPQYGTAIFNGTSWTGTVGGKAFVAFWEVGYKSGQCEFVVTWGGVEVYRVDCYGGQSCRDSSDSVEVLAIYPATSGNLKWQKILHRPLEYVHDSYTYCHERFCGGCECSCASLCATFIGAAPSCCQLKFNMPDVSYPCDGPTWTGSGMCGGVLRTVTLSLSQREYDGACILSGSVNSTTLEPFVLNACVGWTAAWILYDGSSLKVECDPCDCDTTANACVNGCCWPHIINAQYPCGYPLPVPWQISAPGCGSIDGATGSFAHTAVAVKGVCGPCSDSAEVGAGQVHGVLKTQMGSYCTDTPCAINVVMLLECDDSGAPSPLNSCCSGFRLWVGTSVRFAGWDGTKPPGGSSGYYWIKVLPSSCSCSPLAMIFNVTLTPDCATKYLDGPCKDQPTCCTPFCTGFTVTI